MCRTRRPYGSRKLLGIGRRSRIQRRSGLSACGTRTVRASPRMRKTRNQNAAAAAPCFAKRGRLPGFFSPKARRAFRLARFRSLRTRGFLFLLPRKSPVTPPSRVVSAGRLAGGASSEEGSVDMGETSYPRGPGSTFPRNSCVSHFGRARRLIAAALCRSMAPQFSLAASRFRLTDIFCEDPPPVGGGGPSKGTCLHFHMPLGAPPRGAGPVQLWRLGTHKLFCGVFEKFINPLECIATGRGDLRAFPLRRVTAPCVYHPSHVGCAGPPRRSSSTLLSEWTRQPVWMGKRPAPNTYM